MRSVVIEKPNQLTLEERPIPLPGKNEVRVRIKSASICGSDIHIWHGHNPFAKYPRVIGHEFSGSVKLLINCMYNISALCRYAIVQQSSPDCTTY